MGPDGIARKLLCILVLLSWMRRCDGGLEIVLPEDAPSSLRIDYVTVSQRYFRPREESDGLFGQSFKGRLMTFDAEAKKEFCTGSESKIDQAIEVFRDSILVIDFESETEQSYQSCFGHRLALKDIDYLSAWCKISKVLLFVEDRVPGLYYNDHDGHYYEDFRIMYESASNCSIFETQMSETTTKLSDFLTQSWFDGQQVIGNLTVDENYCFTLFSSGFIQFWMRVCLGPMLLGAGVVSMMYFFNMQYRNPRNRLINSIILGVNFVTSFLIGLVLINGGWRITDNITVEVSNFLIPLFFGSGTATTFLLAARWNEIKHEKLLKNKLKGKRAIDAIKRKITTAFAFLLICLDWAASIGFVMISKSTEKWLKLYIPLFFFVSQFLVLVYLVRQVLGMIELLRDLQKFLLKNKTLSTDQLFALSNQEVLIRRLRFWITVNVAAGLLSLVVFVCVGLTSLLEGSCAGWITIWSLALIGKFGQVLAQTKVCGPVPSNQRVQSEESFGF